MAIAKDAKIIGIWGGRGSGKTTRIFELIEKETRVIAFDPIGEFDKRGFTPYTTFAGLYSAIRKNWNKGFKVSLNVSQWGVSPQEALCQLCKDLFIVQRPYYEGKDRREMVLIVEEMSLSVPNQKNKSGFNDFNRLVNTGRHYGVNIYGASQRPAQVHTDFRGNCAEHYFFKPTDHNDVAAIKALIGKDQVNALLSLQPHHYLHWRGLGSVTKGKNTSKFVK